MIFTPKYSSVTLSMRAFGGVFCAKTDRQEKAVNNKQAATAGKRNLCACARHLKLLFFVLLDS